MIVLPWIQSGALSAHFRVASGFARWSCAWVPVPPLMQEGLAGAILGSFKAYARQGDSAIPMNPILPFTV
jgi:hypothetical protein